MPIKRGVGRGRGRGRGGAAAAAASQEHSQTKDEKFSVGGSAVPAPPTNDPNAFSTSAFIAHQEDGSPDLFPSDSPASPPTATPAPTPAKVPVQRLDSLGISGQDAFGVGRGRGRGFGGRVMSTKFKPKAVQRRAADEREKAERDEQARLKERDENARRQQGFGMTSAEGRSASKGQHGMRGRARGRGEAMGRGRSGRDAKLLREAKGLFGIAPAAVVKKKTDLVSSSSHGPSTSAGGNGRGNNRGSVSVTRSTADAGTSENSRATSIKLEYGATPTIGEDMDIDSRPSIKDEFPEPVYPEDQEEGSIPVPKVNIECINLVTDDEDDDSDMVESARMKGKGRVASRGSGRKPVRVEREEHQERVTLVNTEPAAATLIEDSKNSSHRRTNEGVEDQSLHSQKEEAWAGVWRDEVETKSGPELSDNINSNEDTIIEDSAVEQVAIKQADTISRKEKEKSGSSAKQASKQKEPILQTKEDRDEYERHLEDIRILTEELAGFQNPLPTLSLDPNGAYETNEDMMDEPRRDKTGRLYLFQFPPILPPLRRHIKHEEETSDDIYMMDADAGPSAPTPSIDLTAPPEEVIIKSEPGLVTPHFNAPDLITEEGFIGKLIVRRSGKIELDWGGIKLQLGKGAESEFLTTTIIADPPSNEVVDNIMGIKFHSEAEKPDGMGCGLGKVMGKFIVTPDFGGMMDVD